jgi:hypothetical protein
MDISKLLAGIDHTLSTKNLYPEQQDRLYMLRGHLELELERQQKATAFNALSKAFGRALEMNTPSPFLGERLTGGIRNIPGTEGGGVEILPQQTPSTWIRTFLPNQYWTQDRMIIRPNNRRRGKITSSLAI